jgi:hypothetical protein
VTERGTAADGRDGEGASADDEVRSDGATADGEREAADAESRATETEPWAAEAERWSGDDAAEVEGGDSGADPEEIPLPWNTVDPEAVRDDPTVEEFEDLRFVGPKTAATLEPTPIDVEDVVRKRVSYRDLTEHGVNPGVAAKIRREHSLSWSFDAEETDLSRRSTQVRGLDDEERAWIAASSTDWSEAGEDEGEREPATDATGSDGGADADDADAPTPDPADADDEESQRGRQSAAGDGTADGETAVRDEEKAWRRETTSTPTSSEGESATNWSPDPADAVDGEAAWRRASTDATERGATADSAADETADDGATDDEAAWRERSHRSTDRDDAATTEEAAWREQSLGEGGDDRDASRAAEVAWREQSAPTPVTVLDAVDEDDAARLADAGVGSVRRLATADAESIADALELDPALVAEWCAAARDEFE